MQSQGSGQSDQIRLASRFAGRFQRRELRNRQTRRPGSRFRAHIGGQAPLPENITQMIFQIHGGKLTARPAGRQANDSPARRQR